jgi:EAL and modified HD-GYP domain-containing signal transduction protein
LRLSRTPVAAAEVRHIPADDREVKSEAPPTQTDGNNRLSTAGQRFVARQPIFDRAQNVFGYELLFRDGIENSFSAAEPEAASRSTLDTSLLFGLSTLCDGRLAFVNCTRDALLKDLVTLLAADQTVVEILETVEPDDRVIAACKRLKAAGYLIALDDYAPNDPREPLCIYADILKIDFRATRIEQRSVLMRRFGAGRKMLAEKLETPHEFRQARDMGFSLFQGYFFRRPEVLMAREVPANKLHYLRLMEMVCRVDLDLRELENTIKQEAAICYRLLRYLNSPLFGFSLEIKTIRHAMAILGERELRRWIRLIVAVSAAENKCSELILTGLARARFCELLSSKVKSESDLFLMGLLSIMDAILEVQMDIVLEQLPVDKEIKAALLGQASALRPLYQLMLAQESGEWEQSSLLARQLHLSDNEVAKQYWQSLQWAQQSMSGM